MVEEETGDPGETLRHDREVQQARAIAEAVRSELVNCVTARPGPVDLAEATRMLSALRTATALAEDAEDRVLVLNALLNPAEADRRSRARRAGLARRDGGSAASAEAHIRAPRLKLLLPNVLMQPRRTAVTGLAAALTAAGITAAVVIAKGRAKAA
jgi:hypothetical protein